MVRFVAMIGLLLMVGVQTVAAAEPLIRVTGSKDQMAIDPATLPAGLKEGYALMQQNCLACHGEDVLLEPIRRGQEKKYDMATSEREVKVAIMRNLRRPGTNLSRQEGKQLVDFFLRLREIHFP